MFLKSVGSKIASEVSLTNSVLISLVVFCVKSSSILWGTQADIACPGLQVSP